MLWTGKVIKAWEKGIATMKRGEEAILVCSPELAYRRRGRPPHVPPSATLAFSIRLLDWHQGEDLTGDMGVLKTVLEAGVGCGTPGEADVCQGAECCILVAMYRRVNIFLLVCERHLFCIIIAPPPPNPPPLLLPGAVLSSNPPNLVLVWRKSMHPLCKQSCFSESPSL